MIDGDPSGDDRAAGLSLSDPASLWPVLNALTHALAEDSHTHATTVVDGATRELAITRAHLDSGAGGTVLDHTQAQELRAGIEILMQEFRSDFDRLESEVACQQDQIALLVAPLGQSLVSGRTSPLEPTEPPRPVSPAAADERPAAPATVDVATVDVLSVDVANVNVQSEGTTPPLAESDVEAPPPGPEPARAPVTAQTPRPTDHRARWKANALVGAITLIVIVLVLALIGAL
jgi:hypothetical protein